MLFNSWDPVFLGAFWGAFLSFLFYILAYYVPKFFKKVALITKTRTKLHKLYDLLLLERNASSIFFDLINILSFKRLNDILKGNALIGGDSLQLQSESWQIIVLNRVSGSRISITSSNNQNYDLSAKKEKGFIVLLDFLQYLEVISKQKKFKIRINKKRKKAKENLKNLSHDELEKGNP